MSQAAGEPRWRKLGVIAGGGELPARVAEACVRGGRPVFVIALESFAETAEIGRYPHAWAGVGQIGRQLELLKDAGCDAVAFAGVVRRPDFAALKLDWRGARLLPQAVAAAGKGDDALVRFVVGAFEREGYVVVGADEAAGALTAPEGALGACAPDPAHEGDIAQAFRVAQILGAEDVGQGAVVCDGLVLAVEAQEGTDRMLARVAELPAELRGAPGARRGVLAKIAKPGQERRVDLPTMGVRTVEGAARAGLAGIALEAGAAFVIDRDAVVRAADAAGLFVVGVAAHAIARP
ncbi:MAG: UDP-2,3-diacylglucosamine diphosphatase LpxI [Caulobacterales bacterium]|nr:UDP-2,3-diacylglucosamine diphosphatase LpxI [Caulobacterales bacterium]